MAAVFGVVNLYGLAPAAGHAQESSKDAGIEIATIRNQLGVTADIAATLSSTGVKSLPTAANFTLTAGQDVYVAVLQVGGTPAAFHRAVTSAGLGNAGLNAAAGYRFMSSGSGLTAMPATVTISGGTSSANTYWTAIG